MQCVKVTFLRAAMMALTVALVGAAAQAVTIDGVISAGEWTGAPVVITDPNEIPCPDSYDVERIMMMGGSELYVSVEVWNDLPKFTPVPIQTGKAFLNFDWNEVDGPTHYYGLSLNNHKGFLATEMHLVEYADATRTTFVDLGSVNYAIASAIEIEVPWSLMTDVDTNGDGFVTFNSFYFFYNNGGQPPDDDSTNSTIERNDPIPVVPEPLTLTGFALGLGAVVPRLLRRRAAK